MRIIGLLDSKEDLCVCEITAIIGLSQPTISSHLKLLESAGLIDHKKEGLWVNYSINSGMDPDIMLEIKDKEQSALEALRVLKKDRRLVRI